VVPSKVLLGWDSWWDLSFSETKLKMIEEKKMLFALKKNFKLHFQQYFLQPTSDSRQKQQEPDQTSFIIRGKWLAKSET